MDNVIFHTSGTSGNPKSIVRTERSLTADAYAIVETFKELWNKTSLVVSTVQKDHMYGALWVVRAPVAAGKSVFNETIASVEELVALSREQAPLMLVTTPSFLENSLHHPDFKLLKNCFSAIVVSGGKLDEKTSFKVKEATGVAPLEIYGSTETGTVAWRFRPDGEAWNLQRGVKVARNEDGTIRVESAFAMNGEHSLADIITLQPDGRFLLHGRADRQVKILENMVSLEEVERELEKHEYVERARAEATTDGVKRIVSLVVLSIRGKEFAAKYGFEALFAALRRDVLGRGALPYYSFPRRLRVIREIMTDERGKTKAKDVLSYFGNWLPEPLVLDWRQEAQRLVAKLCFPADMICFKGHFPSVAILPGVAQLATIYRFGRQLFKSWPATPVWRKLKFMKVIRPFDIVSMSIEERANGSFAVTLSSGDSLCLSALLESSAS